MDGQSDRENLLKWMLKFGGNSSDVSYGPEDNPNQQFVIGATSTGNQPNALPLRQWTQSQKAPCNYLEFLAENSTFLESASGADMLETITSPVSSGLQSIHGVPEIQRQQFFSNLGKDCGYKPAVPSIDLDTLKTRFQNPHNGVELAHRVTSFQQQIFSQNCTSSTQEAYKDNSNMSQPRRRVTVAPTFYLSKKNSSMSKRRAATTDRDRRIRISERLQALQGLLPHSIEGSQTAVMDDIIEHIKFLQLQLKELSRSRLGGQSTSVPFIFLEGHGHYILNEQMTSEPLEEMMGKLLKMNPSAASQFLESKGLYMMPLSLAEESHQAS